MSGRSTFEVACEVSWCATRPELFRELGVKETMRRHAEAMKPTGWTLKELVDESGRRMREFIENKRAEEASDRGCWDTPD